MYVSVTVIFCDFFAACWRRWIGDPFELQMISFRLAFDRWALPIDMTSVCEKWHSSPASEFMERQKCFIVYSSTRVSTIITLTRNRITCQLSSEIGSDIWSSWSTQWWVCHPILAWEDEKRNHDSQFLLFIHLIPSHSNRHRSILVQFVAMPEKNIQNQRGKSHNLFFYSFTVGALQKMFP